LDVDEFAVGRADLPRVTRAIKALVGGRLGDC